MLAFGAMWFRAPHDRSPGAAAHERPRPDALCHLDRPARTSPVRGQEGHRRPGPRHRAADGVPARRRTRSARGRPRPGQDAGGARRSPPWSVAPTPACSSPPTCSLPTSPAPASTGPPPSTSTWSSGRSSPTSCWPTRSTGRRRRSSRRCWRSWPSITCPSAGRPSTCPTPFLVLATQNPIESEGVYPLPEAQRDRFLMKMVVGVSHAGRGDRDRPPHGREPAARPAGAQPRAAARPAACHRRDLRRTTAWSSTP